MLTLTGTIKAAVTSPERLDRKTGVVSMARNQLQIEGQDHRGLFQIYTLNVPDLAPYRDRVGDRITLPVRAWAVGASVNLSYQEAP